MERKTRSKNAFCNTELKDSVKMRGRKKMKMKIDETSTNSIEAENNVLITVVTRRSARGKNFEDFDQSQTDLNLVNKDPIAALENEEAAITEFNSEIREQEKTNNALTEQQKAENDLVLKTFNIKLYDCVKSESKSIDKVNTEPSTITMTFNNDSIIEKIENESCQIPCDCNGKKFMENEVLNKNFCEVVEDPKIDTNEIIKEVSLRRSRRLKSIYVETTAELNISKEVYNNSSLNENKNQSKRSDAENEENIEAIIQMPLTEPENLANIKLEGHNTQINPIPSSQCDYRLSQFITIRDNIYIKQSDKIICKVNKTMKCDCTITEQDLKNGEMGCRYNCINRLLFIECSSKCRCGEFCDNQQFQRYNYAQISVFQTEKKGFGLRADDDIPPERFIIEYVGEVLNNKQFEKRVKKYSKDKNRHYYFMALRSNAIIDATSKGNISRFINHSCDPNAMTQKWTVNGELRVGFFSIREIRQGEEITFDYQFQRYGKEAQKCFCESENCRGYIGENPESDEEIEVEDSKAVKGSLKSKRVITKKVKPKPDKVELSNEDERENICINEFDEKKISNKEEITLSSDNYTKKVKKRQDFDDLEIEEEIIDLTKSALKNRAHTIRLARLVVRAKSIDARSRLLKILISGDLPCRRLFLDYNGLKLLHNWMCDISIKNSIPDLNLCIDLMDALELLPITNKTILRDSKVLERVEKWKNLDIEKKKLSKEEKKQAKANKKKNKENKLQVDANLEISRFDEPQMLMIRTFDVLQELATVKLIVKERASYLLEKWEVLKEDFRIPKKQKQEIMIEHEREAGMDEWQDISRNVNSNDRYKNRFGEDSISTGSNRSSNIIYRKATGAVERQQYRQLYAMEMAQKEIDKKMIVAHENNCAFFGLPISTNPLNIPLRVNRVNGEYLNVFGQVVAIPPNHHTFKYEVMTLSTNPDNYILPAIDLPDHWKYAIDCYGRIYYYHEKIRQPQWEAPIKILPINIDVDKDSSEQYFSGESETSTEDSEEDELSELLQMLKKKKHLMDIQGSTTNYTTQEINADEDDLEKKIMSNMILNPPDHTVIRLSQIPIKKNLKKKNRRGLSTMQFIRPRTEQDKIYGRTENKRYKEIKEKLRRDKKRRILFGENNISDEDDGETTLEESNLSKMVDELDILNKSKQLDRIRKIKKDVDFFKNKESSVEATKLKKLKVMAAPLNIVDSTSIKRQFRDDIKEEITKFLMPYREDSCVNGKINSKEDFTSLINKLTFSVLTKETKHCAQSNNILKATESVKIKTKEYIKKYMAKFEGAYQRKVDEQDYENILNRI